MAPSASPGVSPEITELLPKPLPCPAPASLLSGCVISSPPIPTGRGRGAGTMAVINNCNFLLPALAGFSFMNNAGAVAQDTAHSVPHRSPSQQGVGSSASQGLSLCPGCQHCRYNKVLFPDAASFCSSPLAAAFAVARQPRASCGKAETSRTPEPGLGWALPSQGFLSSAPVLQHSFSPLQQQLWKRRQ